MDQKKIGLLIMKCRKEKGLTQKELGLKLGVSDKSVSKWERGICLPDVSLFVPLCQLFEIDLNELFLGEKISKEQTEEKLEESILPIVSKYQKITKARKILIIIFFVLTPFILLQWNLKFYTTLAYPTYFYLLALIYIPAYYCIYRGIKIGYILLWGTYFLLALLYLAHCNFYVEWLFNDYSIDLWFHVIITILSLINGDIDYHHLIKKQ